jgi:hypothetical protein
MKKRETAKYKACCILPTFKLYSSPFGSARGNQMRNFWGDRSELAIGASMNL